MVVVGVLGPQVAWAECCDCGLGASWDRTAWARLEPLRPVTLGAQGCLLNASNNMPLSAQGLFSAPTTPALLQLLCDVYFTA